MSGLRLTYLALAIVGTVLPMWHYTVWLAEPNRGLSELFAAWTANGATSGLAADMVIAATALVVWIIAETLVRRNWSALWAIPATFLIGLSCGLPLYLFLRTRPV